MGDRPPELVQYREKDGTGDHRWHVLAGMNRDEPVAADDQVAV